MLSFINVEGNFFVPRQPEQSRDISNAVERTDRHCHYAQGRQAGGSGRAHYFQGWTTLPGNGKVLVRRSVLKRTSDRSERIANQSDQIGPSNLQKKPIL